MKITINATSLHWPEWSSARWFALGIGCFSIGMLIPGRFYRSFPIWPCNAFRRVCEDHSDDCWGFGLLQIGSRHLLFVGSNEEERLKIDFAFVHLLKLGPRRRAEECGETTP
jgi:hypothetical protein